MLPQPARGAPAATGVLTSAILACAPSLLASQPEIRLGDPRVVSQVGSSAFERDFAVLEHIAVIGHLQRRARVLLDQHCIGSHTPPEIAALSAQPGVLVHGHVADIDPYMDGCRIAVAPLRYGAGVKGKINLSMAHGQPVVATACAVEGMHLRDGEDVLVADDPQAFADAVVGLYDDATRWQRLADNGLDNVAAHFSLDAARETVRRVFLTP